MTKMYHGGPCKRGHGTLRYCSTRQCVTCRRTSVDQWRKRHPERARELKHAGYMRRRDKELAYAKRNPASRRVHSWRRLGIDMTWDQYLELRRQQENKCAICGKQPTNAALSVDHDHTTGRIRGLLCRRCNNLVACVDAGLATTAIAYVSRGRL